MNRTRLGDQSDPVKCLMENGTSPYQEEIMLGYNVINPHHSDRLLVEQLKLLLNEMPLGLIANIINSFLIGYILWPELAGNQSTLILWIISVNVLTFIRYFQVLLYRKAMARNADGRIHIRLLYLGVLASGIVWGSIPVVMFPDNTIYQVFIAFVLGGMAAGSISTLSPIFIYYLAYVIPSMLPLAIRFMSYGSELYLIMGGMILLFLILMIFISLRMSRNIIETLSLRFENRDLAEGAIRAKDKLEKTNKELADEIDERKQMDTKLKQTTEQLSILLDSLPIIPYISKGDGDFGASYIAGTVETITGYKAEDFTEDSGFWGNHIHEEDREKVFSNLPELFEKGDHRHEYRWRVSDGSYRWFYDSLKLIRKEDGTPNYIVGAWLDITERKEVEMELQDQLKFINVLMDTIPTPIYFKDPDGAYLGCNKSFEDLSRLKKDKIIGKTDYDLFSKDLAEQYYASDWALYRHPTQLIYESLFVNSGGSERNVIFHKAIFRKGDNSIGGLVGTILDITEQKESEKKLHETVYELKQTQDHLIDTEKLASLGEMIGGITHEINNPINFIFTSLPSLKIMLGNLFDLLDGYSRLEDNREEAEKMIESVKSKIDIAETITDINDLMEVITEGAVRTSNIVKDMQHFTRMSSEAWELSNVNKNIETSLNLLYNQYKRRIVIEKEYGEGDEIECNVRQMDQVLLNILANAIQAIPDKGKISIKTYKKQHNFHIMVSDSGVGIPKDQLSKIFNPFFTTKEVGKGTGLGLSISYEIIKRHHGSVQVKSIVGEGSQFHIILPVSQI